MVKIDGDIRDKPILDKIMEQRYGVIIADPPWPYDNQLGHDSRWGGCPYSPLTIDEIQKIPVFEMGMKDCALYLWGTWPKADFVMDTLKAWGFTYKTGFPWVKLCNDGKTPVYRRGSWVAGCSEFIFIGTKGKISPPPPPKDLGLVGPAFEHSRKPNTVHEMVEGKLQGPYLELFARRTRFLWYTVGNQWEEDRINPVGVKEKPKLQMSLF
jgi:N6-adenosine-specific RNA methylase IME4